MLITTLFRTDTSYPHLHNHTGESAAAAYVEQCQENGLEVITTRPTAEGWEVVVNDNISEKENV